MEGCWPAQYFVNSGIDGERNWRIKGKSSGKNTPRNPLHNLPENLLNTWPVPTVFIGLILGTKEIKNAHLLGQQLLGHSRWCKLWDTLGSRVALARVPQLHPLPLACLWGWGGPVSRKQEMRDYKGIKILLAICPSSHRSKDLLP